MSAGRQWMNLFEIRNLGQLSMAYRLLEVRGLPRGEESDKQINQLIKLVAREIGGSVALVRRGDAHYLAIAADAALPEPEQRLTPHVVKLMAEEEVHRLEFAALDGETLPIATQFVQSALRKPLWEDYGLWGSGRLYYGKRPLNAGDATASVDVYPGFAWNIVTTGDRRLYLALDTVVRYVDRRWLPERLNGCDPSSYLRRHFLYHFGHQWYAVQLWGLTGLSINEQHFMPNGTDRSVDVETYTRERWGSASPPPWVRDLDPERPAILYRYPGGKDDRYGALALCKLMLSTADVEAAGLHRRSILTPAARFAQTTDVVRRHFRGARLGGQPIEVAPVPLEVEPRVFPVPPQRFGHDQVLAVAPRVSTGATEVVPLERLGERRLRLLLDSRAGPLDTSPFDAQYLFLPQSLPREINEDFERRFVRGMREVSGQKDYTVRRVLYDDRQATSLYRQVQAIRGAIASSGISRGYALLVLPTRANRDLHNYIKRELWPDLQFQCAVAGKVQSHYQRTGGDPAYQPAPDRIGRLGSYVRGCALGMMVVNRKWSWKLAAPLHYDVYVGIDVLNRMAGLTFVYNHGQQIFFRDYPSKQRERLTSRQLRGILSKHLREDLRTLGIRPQSIVVHRDGRTFASELEGLHAAVRDLQTEWLLPLDVVVGVVDIRKSTADHLRLVEGESWEACRNPTVGSYYVLRPHEGIVSNTGYPYRFPGTAKPLAASIVEGELDIECVLEDIFALSQPVFTAPDRCERLPLTIKLADDFLEPIAGEADEEEALYEAEEADALVSVADEELSG